MNDLTRSTFIGAATGGRSVTGRAELILTTPTEASTQPDKTFTKPWVKIVAGLLASQE